MPEIRQLPPGVVNKIAAGEVIERPASVVKELVENAVDSGATRIDVALEQGGSELVRVADNGCGVEPGQLPLTVASHATSKIRDADDLFRVRTLGFRGEALASIAEVSRLRIRSRTAESEAGYELEVNGGQLNEVAPCGCPVGTTVEVRNVLFNTPVRRKFLRTPQTEFGHATEAFTRIAIAHPQIHFTLRHNERVLHDLPPVERWRERLCTFFGRELNENLIWVESDDEHVALSGYVASPELSRSNNRLQYLLLNGRFIRDRSLQHALSEAYRGLLMTGRFPIAFLRMDMPPDVIDVNVHPTKIEVRFQDGGRLYSQLLSTLRTKFLSTDLTARVRPPEPPDGPAHDPAAASRHRAEVGAWARGESAAASAPPAPQQQGRLPLPVDRGQGTPEFRRFDDGRGAFARPSQQPAAGNGEHDPATAPAGEAPRLAEADLAGTFADGSSGDAGERAASFAATARTAPPGLQLHNRYLVTEDESGMLVIDQHALHERILYEQLREKVMAGALETQRLLVPEPVSLTAAEAAATLEARDTLSHLGIEVEPFGGDTVVISAYPAMLANISPHEVLRHVVDLLVAGDKAPDRRDMLDELLHMISCKAAIKAGDRLAPEEVAALLEQRHLFQDTHHCPHGRPTALVFTREELDKRFKRI